MKRQSKRIEIEADKPYFESVLKRQRRAEVLYNEFDFQTGDALIFREYDSESKEFTGRKLLTTVTHVSAYEQGLKKGFVLVSIKPIISTNPEINVEREVR